MSIVEGDSGPEGFRDEAYRRGMQLLERLGGSGPEPEGRDYVRGYSISAGALLGTGRFGRVYRARDQAIPRFVAIKFLKPEYGSDAVQQARMENDAAALAILQQSAAADGVVPVFDSGRTEDNRSYLVMQYIDGGSLADRLRANPSGAPQPVEPRVAAGWIEPIARALHVAHRAGIVHRDMKPQNILLTHEGKPKICDFGLARLPDAPDLTADGDLIGTIEYMSPEQARWRDDEIGPAADVYSLGAILYECLTGRPPFRGVNSLQTLELLANTDPIRPEDLVPSVPRDLATICLKCLNKAPGDRYASAEELAQELRRYLNDEPILARRESRRERFAKWRRRNPGVFRWVVLFCTALILGSAFSLGFGLYAGVRAREARSEKQRAERNATYRLRALDDVVQIVSGRQLRMAGQTKLMNQLLEKLLPRFEEVVRSEGRDPKTLEQQGTTWNSLASIRHALGQDDQSLDAARRAEAIFRELSALPDAAPAVRLGLATSLDAQGVLLGMAGKYIEGIALLGEAATLLEGPLPVPADELRRLGRLAHVHNNWANCLMRLGGATKRSELLDQAADHYRRSIEVFGGAIRAAPDDLPNHDWRARVASNLALLEDKRRRPAESLAIAIESVGWARQLVVLAADALDARECLATCLINEGEIRLGRGDRVAALTMLREALRLYERLLAQVPESREFLWSVAMSESDVGAALLDGSPVERAEAAGRLERAAAIYRQLIQADPTNQELKDYEAANGEQLQKLRAAPR